MDNRLQKAFERGFQKRAEQYLGKSALELTGPRGLLTGNPFAPAPAPSAPQAARNTSMGGAASPVSGGNMGGMSGGMGGGFGQIAHNPAQATNAPVAQQSNPNRAPLELTGPRGLLTGNPFAPAPAPSAPQAARKPAAPTQPSPDASSTIARLGKPAPAPEGPGFARFAQPPKPLLDFGAVDTRTIGTSIPRKPSTQAAPSIPAPSIPAPSAPAAGYSAMNAPTSANPFEGNVSLGLNGGTSPQAVPRPTPPQAPQATPQGQGPSNAYLAKVMGSYNPNSRVDQAQAARIREIYQPGMSASQIYSDPRYQINRESLGARAGSNASAYRGIAQQPLARPPAV